MCKNYHWRRKSGSEVDMTPRYNPAMCRSWRSRTKDRGRVGEMARESKGCARSDAEGGALWGSSPQVSTPSSLLRDVLSSLKPQKKHFYPENFRLPIIHRALSINLLLLKTRRRTTKLTYHIYYIEKSCWGWIIYVSRQEQVSGNFFAF